MSNLKIKNTANDSVQMLLDASVIMECNTNEFVSKTVTSISKLATATTTGAVNVINYHSDLKGGGGVFYWDATGNATEHNGGTVISTLATFPTDWNNQTQLSTWFDGAALTGTGVWRRQYDGAVNVKWFGAKGDGVTDDTSSFSNAILFSAVKNGKLFLSTSTYLVLGTLFIPSFFELDLNKSTIIGAGIGSTNALFESAYLSDGVLSSNINVADTYVTRATVKNGFIKNCGKAFNVERLIDGCEIRDIQFENCTYAIHCDDSYYARYINLLSRGSANSASNAAFYFGTYVNVEALESIFVIDRSLGIEIAINGNALTLKNCSAEHCGEGIRVSGSLNPIKFDTCYIENVSGVGISITGAGTRATFDNCFLNSCSTGIYAGPHTEIDVNTNTTFINMTYKVTCDNDYNVFGNIGISDVAIPNNSYPVNATGYTIGKKMNVEYKNILYDNLSGEALIKGQVFDKAIIPFIYSGDPGSPLSGTVPFCLLSKTAGTTFDVYIDTQIKYNSLGTFVGFDLECIDNDGIFRVYGIIFGDTAIQFDTKVKTVTALNNSGYLRLKVSTLTHPNEIYSVTGIIRYM
jgi:hypothetical protein